jgi:hypothetical protein
LILRLALTFVVLPSVVLTLGLSVNPAAAGEDSERERRRTYEGLTLLSACELEQMYASACPGEMPVGFLRGRLLVLVDFPMPRASVACSGLAWKGKHIAADGTFINQFTCRRRISSKAVIAESWLDGKPSIVMAYPPGTPLFENVRDEFREVHPRLYLGLVYRRCPKGLIGYMCLQVDPKKCGKPYPSLFGYW